MTARIAIYGAGAIGGYMGALLADTDAEVTLIARGPHLHPPCAGVSESHPVRKILEDRNQVHTPELHTELESSPITRNLLPLEKLWA